MLKIAKTKTDADAKRVIGRLHDITMLRKQRDEQEERAGRGAPVLRSAGDILREREPEIAEEASLMVELGELMASGLVFLDVTFDDGYPNSPQFRLGSRISGEPERFYEVPKTPDGIVDLIIHITAKTWCRSDESRGRLIAALIPVLKVHHRFGAMMR